MYNIEHMHANSRFKLCHKQVWQLALHGLKSKVELAAKAIIIHLNTISSQIFLPITEQLPIVSPKTF